MKNILGIIAVALFLAPMPVLAEDASLSFGGDQYSAGQNTALQTPIERDAFMVGNSVSLDAPVKGDAHLGGNDIKVNGAVGGNLYAAGFSVGVNAPVGGDVTAAGNSVTLAAAAPVTGNARLAGATVSILAPVSGAALISAQTLNLDAAIAGDVNFYGETITFGPNAKVVGNFTIHAPKPIDVPASVAAPGQVKFEPLTTPDYVGEVGKTTGTVVSRVWPAIWGTIGSWILLTIIGIAFIALAPRLVTRMEQMSEQRPFSNLGLGVFGFAAVLGLVPVFALTLIGILALPFVLIFVLIVCSLAYLGGVYFLGRRIAKAFMAVTGNGARAMVLAISLVAAILLGLIPVLGWLLVLAFVVFGFGLFTRVLMLRWSEKDRATAVNSPA